ncbi:MAG TPA: DUF222 domain-containing protein [Streptosporangiaceae bacterium]|nr:DUF222 domain-containing protein [Streptosporangiaceae bacterium]
MPSGPVSQQPGRDDPCPAGGWPEWMDDPAYLALRAGGEDLDDPDLEEDPEDVSPPEADDGELSAEADRITGELAREAVLLARLGLTGVMAAQAAAAAGGRRGPGMPGSAGRVPGVSVSRAAGFASAMPLDVAPGCLELAWFAEDAAGEDDRYRDASDDELAGVICAWERSQAYISARKHAAVAEFIRRRPAPGCGPQGPARMPEGADEFAAQELAAVLGETRVAAGRMLSLARELEVNLPGTEAALRAGILSERKAAIIAWATAVLDPDQARAAEAQVLDRAATLTPPGLRAAIGRAVMEVAPKKARRRREHEAARARVERWAEDSGNAGLAGRELPVAQVLAADQRVTAWAGELKRAGLGGGMDALRARAYLDILLGMDSRPPGSEPGGTSTSTGTGTGTARGPAAVRAPAQDLAQARAQAWAPVAPDGGPLAGVIPPGFAGHVTLTIPEATVTRGAGRPAELGGIGPVDPDLARDLAAAAARNPRSTWHVTVTDRDGHAVAHGCARPATRRKPGGHDPPGEGRFTFTPAGPGTWRLVAGPREMLVRIEPLRGGECDHRHQAAGHDPGVMLRHLTEVRHATCTGPGCRRPAARCDFEHTTPYDAGGRTCLCNGDLKCRSDHRMKQDPRWRAEQLPGGYVRWTMPSGRQHVTEPTRYPI